MQLETLVNVYHCLSGSETAYHQDIQRALNMVSTCMTICGETERLDFVPTQRSAIDTTRPIIQKGRREGRRGVRMGGPGSRRDAGLSQLGTGCSDPPRASWHAGSSSQMRGADCYADVNLDEYFGVRLQTPEEDEAEVDDDAEEDEAQEAASDDDTWRESRTKAHHDSGESARKDLEAASSSKGLARTITKFFTRRTSSRTSKGVAANKFTPSGYK